MKEDNTEVWMVIVVIIGILTVISMIITESRTKDYMEKRCKDMGYNEYKEEYLHDNELTMSWCQKGDCHFNRTTGLENCENIKKYYFKEGEVRKLYKMKGGRE